MAEELLREQLYAQIKNRAMMYFHIFNEMREEIGEERAIAVMKRAIYKRGRGDQQPAQTTRTGGSGRPQGNFYQ